MYLNFAETPRPTDTPWTTPALERLRAVKATVDPDNLLRANHSVPPAD
jgi:FAD/FMN-containing dehydrogenase